MKYIIEGSTMQILKIELDSRDGIYSETGVLLYMTPSIDLQTNFSGGIGGVLKRMVTGNSLALNHFRTAANGVVAFTTRLPGHILPFEIRPGNSILVQKHSFLCAEESVRLELAASFNLAGFFGGNGLLFNELSGNGIGFISIDGETTMMDLKYGESVLVHPGHVAAYEGSVRFEIQRLQGFKNMFFGGDGVFLARLTGPGRVWMHSLSIHNLAEVMSTIGRRSDSTAGSMFGDLFD